MSCLLRLSTPLKSNFKPLFSSRNRLRALNDAIVLLVGRRHVGHKNANRLHAHGSACMLVAGTQDVAFESADLQDSPAAGLESQSNQPAGPSIFPPFCGKLSVDEGIKLSNQNFKQLIENSFRTNKTLLSQVQRTPSFPTPNLIAHLASKANLASKWDYFSKGKFVTTLSQLTATPPFPTPHVLAKFAYKAYEDYRAGETDAQYETRLALPDGWKLLTTASNASKTNGYFGAAYWHPEHQQVVIAHRGTKFTTLGALWTDVVGVLFKNHTPQIGSSSTFAHKIVEVLRESNEEKGTNFHVFFTGHSLGGWLAQITTFTTEYLKREGNSFLKNNNDQDCFHPHTVVFDSPGCKDMLLQMTDKLDVRLHGRSIDIENLDITSYLSAPNRINTCNAHLGTVYRIFPDWSDMGWWGRNTVFYNLATHSMQKIVEAFDPVTGQVYKDGQDKLKVQLVIDWPISAGLSGGKEYKNFFEWAKHLNNYHPNMKDISFQPLHYSPIRYQTKLYDERVNSFSIFSEKEQVFLQYYHWLRQWLEFFKPKELFSELKENQAQEAAEKLLQSFEIEKDTIRCTDGSSLQAMIPYVKRLLQLFPQIRENTKRALSSDGVRNRVYQFETRRYVERISQSPLQFNSDSSSITGFLENEEEKVLHLQMIKVDEWTGLIKVYQFLQKTGRLIEGQYTVLKLNRLLKVNQLMDLSKLMQSTVTHHLILMSCEDNQLLNEETKDVLRTLFDTIKQKSNIKIIFMTRSGGSTVAFLKHMGRRIFGKRFITRVEHETWSDLTASSQEKLLEKSVKFQGAEISLNQLMSAGSPVATFLPLGALLEEKELTIADPVQISNAYSEDYYIGRTLRHQKAIEQGIFNDIDVRDSHVYLAREEQEYKQLCQLNPKSNVHWLQHEKTGKILWQHSQGSLETVRRYIDTKSSHRYTPDDLDKLLEQAQHQRVMLISDTAGTGKSTILSHLAKQIKQKFPAKWVVRIDLNDHTEALRTLKQKQIDKKNTIEFVSKKLLKLKPGLEMALFKQCFEQRQKVRTIIMIDGFDEISPFYKESVIFLLQALRQTAVEQLWVTTRPHLRKELENELQQLSYTLEPFSAKDQVEILIKFWSPKELFTEVKSKETEETKKELEIYAKKLIRKMAESIRDKDREFIGIPLQTRMLAEAFHKDVKTFLQSAESKPNLPFKLDLIRLYRRFIERKYDFYHEEKFRVNLNNVVEAGQRERDLKCMREDHQLLALKVLFTEEQVALFQNNRKCSFSAEDLTRMGIVQMNCEGKLHFIHRTFAECYVADCLVNSLTDVNNTSQQVQTFILTEIFQKEQYRVIRAFVDGLLLRSKTSKEVLKQYGNEIYRFGFFVQEAFDKSDYEGNYNILGLLLECVQAAGSGFGSTVCNTAEIMKCIRISELSDWAKKDLKKEVINNKLLLPTDDEVRTVRHPTEFQDNLETLQKIWDWSKLKQTTREMSKRLLLTTENVRRIMFEVAASQGNLEALEEIWHWTKETLTTQEMHKIMLLATDSVGRTVWHLIASQGNLESLQKIWDWTKETLTTEEINNKLLFATDDEGRTIWHMAAERGNLEALQKLWGWTKETLTTEEMRKKLLLTTDNVGRTVWHMVAKKGNLEALKEIWNWTKEILTTEEINNKFLFATDDEGRTIWHVAAERGNLEALQKLWDLTKETLTTEEMLKKLLLTTDGVGKTVWHMVARKGNLEALQNIWDWTKETLTTEDIKNKLLFATDDEGWTVWHLFASQGNLEALQKVWNWSKETLTTEKVNKKILFATDDEGRTFWHVAAEWGNLEVLQKVWDWTKEAQTTEEISKKLLFTTDSVGRTVWHMVASQGNLEALQKIWDWTKETLTPEEINNRFLFATNVEGWTVWHVAARRGNLEALQKVWDWTKEILTTEDMRKKLLLTTDRVGRTVWHLIASENNLEILQEIWDWTKETLTTEEINKKLLLATDDEGRTVWHVAAEWGNLEALQNVWDWTKETLTTQDISKKLLLTTDGVGRTVWHMVARDGNLEALHKIWEWTIETLTTEEINNKLLFATDDEGWTVWHLFASQGNLEALQTVWDWTKETLTTEEINNKLLLATADEGRTFHVAAEWCPFLLKQLCEWAEEARNNRGDL